MKAILSIGLLVLFLGLAVGMNIYLAKRFSMFFNFWSYKTWLWIFMLAFAGMFAGMGVFVVTANPAGSMISAASTILIGFVIYLFLSVVVTDLLSLAVKISPEIKGIVSISLAVLFVGYGMWNATNIRVKEITIPMKGLSEEVKAVHLSDIHLGHYWGKKHLQKIVRKTNALHPDIIFNTGDLFDARFRLSEEVFLPFKEIKVPHYFVEGNHDKYVGVEKVTEYLKRVGVKVLENEISSFNELQIVGLKHMLADHETFDMHAEEGESTIKDILAELPVNRDKPTVLLHHSPDGIKYADEKNVDLYLAGHTHGGQFFPFNLLAAWTFFKYNSGIYNYNQLVISVSEGLGTFFAPLRIGTSGSIMFYRLIPL